MPALPYTARGNALARGNGGTDTFVENRRSVGDVASPRRNLLADIASFRFFNTPVFRRIISTSSEDSQLELTFNLSEAPDIRHFLKGLYRKVTITSLNWHVLVNAAWTHNIFVIPYVIHFLFIYL